MAKLKHSEWQGLFNAVAELHRPRPFDAFASDVVRTTHTVLSAESAFFNEFDEGAGGADLYADPRERISFPNATALFQRYHHDNPLVVHYRKTGESRALRISDVMPRSEFHRT